jgi:hypothetical protein
MVPIPWLTALTVVARPLRADLNWAITNLRHWDLALSDLELL